MAYMDFVWNTNSCNDFWSWTDYADLFVAQQMSLAFEQLKVGKGGTGGV